MRVGELRKLRREDVDLIRNWIHVVSRKGEETKTRTSRKVPIHVRLRPVLESVMAQARGNYVFVAPPTRMYPDGGRQINRPHLNRQFQWVAARLGMPTGRDEGFVLHSLRRFFKSHAENQGIPQRVLDTWLGHNSDKSMGAVYYRLRDEESQEFMRKVMFPEGPPTADVGKED
jgi:integrase